MGPKKWNFLQDEPCAQVIRYVGDRLPSFLPNGRMVGCSAKDKSKVVEATISRKAECIVIMWCSTFRFKSRHPFDSTSSTLRLCVNRGGELAEESKISLHESHFDHSQFWGCRPIIHCVTLRRKHRVVEAVKPGDKLHAYIEASPCSAMFTSEANVCVVYNGDGHSILEVNSKLLGEDASRELEEQFGGLILNGKNKRKGSRKGVCGTSSLTFATRKRSANLRRRTSNK